MIKIEAYQCEYCTKHRKGTGKPIRIYRRSIDTHYHEAGCYYNPQNRTCLTCKYGEFERSDNGYEYPQCEGYDYPDNCKGSRYFGSQWIRENCPHWESEGEEG